jgi:glutamate synthase domain-containing protein 3
MIGERVIVEVAGLEFVDGGNTIWVHGMTGGTVLRIQCSGKILVKPHCTNSVAHADIQVVGDIEVCLPDEPSEPR